MYNIALLYQTEATQGQYIFNFILMNVIFIFAYAYRNRNQSKPITWCLILIFLLFAYWDTDYFSFRHLFYTSLENFRDPLYYYLSLISFNSYTIFRLVIWGTALLLFKKTSDRYGISPNIAAYVFSIFFLLTFSYARVSLGMAMYFYGLSFLIKPHQTNKYWGFVWGLAFVCCSYFGHRSLVVLIALTPLAIFQLDRKKLLILCGIGVMISGFAATLLSDLISGSLSVSDTMGAAGEAAEQYANIETEVEYNWKFTLMRNLRFYSIYIAMAYIAWKVSFSKLSKKVAPEIKRLATISCAILIFSVSFLLTPSRGADIIGYRYLFMVGLPICTIIAYLASYKLISKKMVSILLLLAFLYSEGFIFGKILSF